jgi:PTS system cellobiose-specific IIA component
MRFQNHGKLSTYLFYCKNANRREEKMDDAQMAVIMPLIMYGGEAKSSAVEAIRAAKAGDFEKADERIEAASKAIVEAHHGQTELLTKAANGEDVPVSIYMVHAQDHLMTGIAFVDLAKEIIELYKVIKG